MPLWFQHLLVLLIVAGCVMAVAWQGVRTMRGKKSRLGSCCASGCPQPAKAAKEGEKVAFLPVEMLSRRRG